jgi:hypothetical protein
VRRVWTSVAVAAATGVTIFVTTACTGDAKPASTASPSSTASASVRPSASPTGSAFPGDPAVMAQTCTKASKILADGTKLFNDQLAVLEKAAAKGDQTGMAAAATAISTEFTAMATELAPLAQASVSSQLRSTLTTAAGALTDLGSSAYSGTTADTKRKLADLSAALSKACA